MWPRKKAKATLILGLGLRGEATNRKSLEVQTAWEWLKGAQRPFW